MSPNLDICIRIHCLDCESESLGKRCFRSGILNSFRISSLADLPLILQLIKRRIERFLSNLYCKRWVLTVHKRAFVSKVLHNNLLYPDNDRVFPHGNETTLNHTLIADSSASFASFLGGILLLFLFL